MVFGMSSRATKFLVSFMLLSALGGAGISCGGGHGPATQPPQPATCPPKVLGVSMTYDSLAAPTQVTLHPSTSGTVTSWNWGIQRTSDQIVRHSKELQLDLRNGFQSGGLQVCNGTDCTDTFSFPPGPTSVQVIGAQVRGETISARAGALVTISTTSSYISVPTSWDFGGGITPSHIDGAEAKVVFATPGVYDASLTSCIQSYPNLCAKLNLKCVVSDPGTQPLISGINPASATGREGDSVHLTASVTRPVVSYLWELPGMYPSESTDAALTATLTQVGDRSGFLTVTDTAGVVESRLLPISCAAKPISWDSRDIGSPVQDSEDVPAISGDVLAIPYQVSPSDLTTHVAIFQGDWMTDAPTDVVIPFPGPVEVAHLFAWYQNGRLAVGSVSRNQVTTIAQSQELAPAIPANWSFYDLGTSNAYYYGELPGPRVFTGDNGTLLIASVNSGIQIAATNTSLPMQKSDWSLYLLPTPADSIRVSSLIGTEPGLVFAYLADFSPDDHTWELYLAQSSTEFPGAGEAWRSSTIIGKARLISAGLALFQGHLYIASQPAGGALSLRSNNLNPISEADWTSISAPDHLIEFTTNGTSLYGLRDHSQPGIQSSVNHEYGLTRALAPLPYDSAGWLQHQFYGATQFYNCQTCLISHLLQGVSWIHGPNGLYFLAEKGDEFRDAYNYNREAAQLTLYRVPSDW